MRKTTALICTLLATGAATAAHTATVCGPPAATCTSTFDINIEVKPEVAVTNLDDIALGTWDPTTGVNMTATEDMCAYYNNASNYQLTFTTANAGGGNFNLNSSGNLIAYTVNYDDGGGYDPVTEGVAANFTGANQSSTTCGGVDNGTILITVPDGNIRAAGVSGTYTDTLTILMEPGL